MSTLLDAPGVARKLNRSRSWFHEHRRELESRGFPRPIPVVGRWDEAAIDNWISGARKLERSVQQDDARRRCDAAFGL